MPLCPKLAYNSSPVPHVINDIFRGEAKMVVEVIKNSRPYINFIMQLGASLVITTSCAWLSRIPAAVI